VWVLRGDRGEPRDPALHWATGQVRDAGGLQGWTPARLPIRSLEWGIAAFLVAFAASWAGRRARVVLLVVAALLAAAPALDSVRGLRHRRAIVRTPVTLAGPGVDLSPGQVVQLARSDGRHAHIEAGPGLAGDVPVGALLLEDVAR